MKGNPMQRNFGIGTPAKQFEEGDYYDTRSKSPSKQFEEGDYYDTRSKSPNKQTYDANGTDERVYDVNQEKYDKWREGKGAPDVRYLGAKENKKHLESYLNFKKSGGKLEKVKSVPKGYDYDTDPDRLQNDVKAKSPNKQTISSVSDSLQNLPNPSAEKLKKEYEKALKKLQKEAQEKLDANTDSTNQSNSDVLNKRANQIQQNVSPKEFDKQVEDFNKKNSPNKQRDLGGTKSGKGNVFTKRGRTQKKINAERAETAKLKKEHIAENKRSTYLATKDHEAKMIKKQLKNRPKTVVMKGDKDVTDQYR
jgi:hypothetical protein